MMDTSDTICGNSGALNGQSQYEYKPLMDKETRLFQLEPGHGREPLICSLLHHADVKAGTRSWTALSYAWGTQSRPCVLFCGRVEDSQGRSTILNPPQVIPITAALDTILRRRREAHHSDCTRPYFWVDAVCINQDDLEERKCQVLLMGDIYANAEATLVCLEEDHQNDFDKALQCIKRLNECFEHIGQIKRLQNSLREAKNRPWLLKKDHSAYVDEALWRAFERLLSSSWFSRVWVFQEAVLSRVIHVLYNDYILEWHQLVDACQLVNDFQLSIARFDNQPLHLPLISINEARSWKKVMLRTNDSYGCVPLNRLLLMLRNARSSDGRDKVYALLSISSGFNRSMLVPDYSLSLFDCYANTAIALSAMNDARVLDSLAFLSSVQHEDIRLNPDLPSWCPDWRKPLQAPWIISVRFYFPSQRTPAKAKFLEHHPRVLVVRGVSLMRIVGFQTERHMNTKGTIMENIEYPTTYEPYTAALDGRDLEQWQFELFRESHGAKKRRPFWSSYTQNRREDVVGRMFPEFYDSNATEPSIDISAWDRAEDVQGISHGRRSFMINLGFVGLGPIASTIGDEVCMLYGGRVLYVIRREGKRACFIGECAVLGLMNGEVLEGLPTDKVEEFELY